MAPSRGDLTVSQQNFVLELTRVDEGKPRDAAEAWLRAFDAEVPRKQAALKAAWLLKRDSVKNELARVQRARDLEARRNASESRSWVERQLRGIVSESDRDSDRIAALRELRQLVPDTTSDDLSTLARHEVIDRIRLLLASQLGLITNVVVDSNHGGDTSETRQDGTSERHRHTTVDAESIITVDTVSSDGVSAEDPSGDSESRHTLDVTPIPPDF